MRSSGQKWNAVRFLGVGVLLLGATSCSSSEEAAPVEEAAASASPQATELECEHRIFERP